MSMTDEKPVVDRMISALEVGNILGITAKTVLRMMEDGLLPGYQVRHVWKFKRSDIDKYLEEHRYQPEQKKTVE